MVRSPVLYRISPVWYFYVGWNEDTRSTEVEPTRVCVIFLQLLDLAHEKTDIWLAWGESGQPGSCRETWLNHKSLHTVKRLDVLDFSYSSRSLLSTLSTQNQKGPNVKYPFTWMSSLPIHLHPKFISSNIPTMCSVRSHFLQLDETVIYFLSSNFVTETVKERYSRTCSTTWKDLEAQKEIFYVYGVSQQLS